MKLKKVRDIKFSKRYYVFGELFKLLSAANQEKKQIPRYEVRFTNKIIHLCGLFAKHAQKFYCLTQRHR